MNIIRDGLIKIHKEFSELGPKWDGYKAKRIKKIPLNSIRDMSFISDQLGLFKRIGFQEIDVEVVPCQNGNIQIEAENKNRCLIIEVDNDYYKVWNRGFKKRFNGRPSGSIGDL